MILVHARRKILENIAEYLTLMFKQDFNEDIDKLLSLKSTTNFNRAKEILKKTYRKRKLTKNLE